VIGKRQRKDGSIGYWVRVERSGTQRWVGTFNRLADARKAERQAKERHVRTMSCDTYVDHFLTCQKDRVKDSTLHTNRHALRGFAQDFRGIALDRVSKTEAKRWAIKNRWRVPVVVALFNAAVEEELVDRNPFKGLSSKGPGRKHFVPLTIAEVNELAQIALEEHGPQVRALVLFLAYEGIRPGEAFALEWTDIDFDTNRIYVQRRVYRGALDLPKNGKARRIVFTPPARDAIENLPRDDRLVFIGKQGKRLSQSLLTWYWAPIAARFGRKITPYELRHFAGHYLHVKLGLPDRVVAVQLGHTDGGKLVRELYGHGDIGALEEIDRAFDNVLPLRRRSHGP
jgi:integrase